MSISDYVGIVLAVVMTTLIGWAGVKAQEASPPAVPQCEAIAAAGQITVYYCEPDMGLPFYINSVGFMVLED